MTRRRFAAWALALPASVLADEPPPVTVRGKLIRKQGEPCELAAAGGGSVVLEGDEQTTGVLRDSRLKDAEFELIGHYTPSGSLRILPIHKRGLYVWKDGKRLFVTYWCEVCSIRTYTPGICWCCQDETALDLREKLDH